MCPFLIKKKHFMYICIFLVITKYFYLYFSFIIKKIQLQNIQILIMYFKASKISVFWDMFHILYFLNLFQSFPRVSLLISALWKDLVLYQHSLNFHFLYSLHLSIQLNKYSLSIYAIIEYHYAKFSRRCKNVQGTNR